MPYIVKAQENLKLSHCWPGKRQSSDTNQRIKAFFTSGPSMSHRRIVQLKRKPFDFKYAHHMRNE